MGAVGSVGVGAISNSRTDLVDQGINPFIPRTGILSVHTMPTTFVLEFWVVFSYVQVELPLLYICCPETSIMLL